MTHTKKTIRPIIESAESFETSTPEERFQNETLRPIIKMQHRLLVAFFKNYLLKKKMEFDDLTPFKQKAIITNAFSKDIQFKMEIRGIIIGQLTLEEYMRYLDSDTNLNKRISSMLQERLISTI